MLGDGPPTHVHVSSEAPLAPTGARKYFSGVVKKLPQISMLSLLRLLVADRRRGCDITTRAPRERGFVVAQKSGAGSSFRVRYAGCCRWHSSMARIVGVLASVPAAGYRGGSTSHGPFRVAPMNRHLHPIRPRVPKV